MDDKILYRKYIILCLEISLFIYDVINRLLFFLGRVYCFLCRLYLFLCVGGKYEFSGWLFIEVIVFKIL